MDLESNRTYTANGLNQYTNIVEGAGGFLPQFDDDGNQTLIQTSTGIWQVQYNGENRPTRWERISSNSSTPNSSTPTLISMSFDRMGRRVQYLETCGSVTNSNKAFTYDGYLQIANFEHQTSNFKLQTFIWDPTEPVATRPLVWNFSTFQPFNFSTSYYTHDGNKNVSDLVASSNLSVTAHYEYAPFGKIIVDAGSNEVACAIGQSSCNPFGFSSEYNDEALDLVYYNYRQYATADGRWICRDPFYDLDYVFLRNKDQCRFDLLGLKDWNNRIHSGCSDGDIDNVASAVLKKAVARMNGDEGRNEFFGSICCKCENGIYKTFSTGPYRGSVKKTLHRNGSIVCREEQKYSPQTAKYAACPRESTLVGYYHTHPYGHNFSPGDKAFVKGGKIPLYMAYDDNRVQRLDPWMTDNPKRAGIKCASINMPGGIPINPVAVEVR